MARRALLTDGEREALRDPDSRDNPYVAVSRVRRKIHEELTRDVDLLEEHNPDLLEELREVVCEGAERAHQRPREPSEPTRGTTTVSEPPTREADLQAPGEDESNDLREQLRAELPGSGDLLETRVDEVLAMYDYLVDHGIAEKDELLDVVDVDATRYDSRESVWSNMVKGRDTLRALPGVETPPEGRSEWTYTGNGA